MSSRFTGLVAVVTGGGAGIGASVCHRLSAEGARVAIVDRDATGAAATASTCPDSIVIEADLSTAAGTSKAAAEVAEKFGAADVLVNCAAVARSSLLSESTDDHWMTLINTNFLSIVRLTRELIPGMRTRGGGSIVNVSSLRASRGYPEWSAYASAKGALISFTKQQAVEQAPYGIRCNLVTPGAIMTPLNQQRIDAAPDPQAFRDEMSAQSVFGRAGTPEEVAAAIAFVASSEASFVTGADIVCDGGAAVLGP